MPNVSKINVQGGSYTIKTSSALVTYDNTDSGLSSDNVQDAIDEVKSLISTGGVTLTETLTAGSTSVTFTDVSITDSAMYDFYTDVWGVNPTSVSVTNGQLSLTFDSQSSDVSVKVVIK